MVFRWILRFVVLLVVMPCAVFYLFILPAWVASGTSALSVGTVVFAGFLYVQLWVLTAELAYESAATLYSFSRPVLFPFRFFRAPKDRAAQSGFTVIFFCGLSYLFTVYGFAIAYAFISKLNPHAFNVGQLTIVDALYFSIVTAATIGYGDVSPVSTTAKLFVIAEILVCLLYAVFFFSILAGAIRHDTRRHS